MRQPQFQAIAGFSLVSGRVPPPVGRAVRACSDAVGAGWLARQAIVSGEQEKVSAQSQEKQGND